MSGVITNESVLATGLESTVRSASAIGSKSTTRSTFADGSVSTSKSDPAIGSESSKENAPTTTNDALLAPIEPAPQMESVAMPDPQVGDCGTVTSVNVSKRKGTRKSPVEAGVIMLDSDYGVHGDAHAGNWHRQVSFLAEESIDVAKDHGLDVSEGDFGENITVSGINMKGMPLGARLSVGTAEIEISQIGKICHRRCAIFYLAGDCIFPREGVFGWVVKPGAVRVGDTVQVLSLGSGQVHHLVSDTPLPEVKQPVCQA